MNPTDTGKTAGMFFKPQNGLDKNIEDRDFAAKM